MTTNTCDNCGKLDTSEDLVWITSDDFEPAKGEKVPAWLYKRFDALCEACYLDFIKVKRYVVHDLQGASLMDYSHHTPMTAIEIRSTRWSDYTDNFMNDPENKMRWQDFTLDFIADFWELEFEEAK